MLAHLLGIDRRGELDLHHRVVGNHVVAVGTDLDHAQRAVGLKRRLHVLGQALAARRGQQAGPAKQLVASARLQLPHRRQAHSHGLVRLGFLHVAIRFFGASGSRRAHAGLDGLAPLGDEATGLGHLGRIDWLAEVDPDHRRLTLELRPGRREGDVPHAQAFEYE